MNSNDNLLSNTASPSTASPVTAPEAPRPGAIAELDAAVAGNDNAARGGIPDTTLLVAHPDVVRSIGATLRRKGVASQDLEEAIADVQVASIEVARSAGMPASLAQWKALATTIAVRRSLNRVRNARRRRKYDAGLCEEPDAYLSPTLHWEHRDPVDTKRFLVILKELFDTGQMPEDGQEILQAEADEVPREEIAAELGLTKTIVRKRLFRVRAKFRARLTALGMLVLLMLLLVASVVGSVGGVATPPPQTQPPEPPPDVSTPAWDGSTAPHSVGVAP
jgi:DNA-directed RNA polymerase specialized sigma24 family protein